MDRLMGGVQDAPRVEGQPPVEAPVLGGAGREDRAQRHGAHAALRRQVRRPRQLPAEHQERAGARRQGPQGARPHPRGARGRHGRRDPGLGLDRAAAGCFPIHEYWSTRQATPASSSYMQQSNCLSNECNGKQARDRVVTLIVSFIT